MDVDVDVRADRQTEARDGCVRSMMAAGEPKKKSRSGGGGGGNVRKCVCGCGVDARSFSFVLTKKRVDRGGVDLLTPLTRGMGKQKRRRIRKQIAKRS